MCYGQRISWIRSQIKTCTELQLADKAILRQPHKDYMGDLQWRALKRSYEITALLTMLNTELNKVRPEPKGCAHAVADKWTKHVIGIEVYRLTKALDEAHPYPKLYVVVEKSLSPIQKGIQAAHAVAQLFKQHGVLDHSALVFLEASNLYRCYGLAKGLRTGTFFEPSWGGKQTAIAIEPLEEERMPEAIRNLPLAA